MRSNADGSNENAIRFVKKDGGYISVSFEKWDRDDDGWLGLDFGGRGYHHFRFGTQWSFFNLIVTMGMKDLNQGC